MVFRLGLECTRLPSKLIVIVDRTSSFFVCSNRFLFHDQIARLQADGDFRQQMLAVLRETLGDKADDAA